MKLTKIIALLTAIVLCISFTGCKKQDEADTQGTQERVINSPYAYSANSKTLHHSTCYHVKRISDANLVEYTGDPADMVANGFKLCSVCFPNSNVNNNTNNDNGISEEDATYVINTGTRKFHEKDCDHAINASNTEYTDLSYEELIEENYEPCQVCLKNYKGDNAD